MIVKSVFREQLNRDNIVKVLRSRFSVKANTLTTLTVSHYNGILNQQNPIVREICGPMLSHH